MRISNDTIGRWAARSRLLRSVLRRAALLAAFVVLAFPAIAGGSKDAAPAGAPDSAQGAAASGSSAPARLFATVGDPNYRSPRHAPIDRDSLENQSVGLSPDWWVDSAFYHVWVKSFSDYDGDGVGDFRGITAKLDYIKDEVGCDAIWLSPIFDCGGKGSSPDFNMHGYDTVDYYEVNDYFGNKEQLAELLAAAHKRGMKVIFDFVPNHTSNAHPWFLQSVGFDPEKKDWYLWNDKKLPWSPMGNANTWYRSDIRQSYYYGAFWSGMPDLNFNNREVREEMKNVVRYWLDFGFDGLRIDAVRYLLEEGSGAAGTADTKGTHAFWGELRAEVVDRYAELGVPKFMVGEAWINGDRPRLESYFGSRTAGEFNMLFDFDFSGKVAMAVKNRNMALFQGGFAAGEGSPPGARLAVFLSNHDNLSDRPGTVYRDADQLRAASALSLLVPATPFVYYGNEIGQPDQKGKAGQDIRLRQPFDWSSEAAQSKAPDSLLALHKDLLTLRAAHPALRRGTWKRLDLGSASLGSWTAETEGEKIACVFNLGPDTVTGVSDLIARSLGVARLVPLYEGGSDELGRYGFAVYKAR